MHACDLLFEWGCSLTVDGDIAPEAGLDGSGKTIPECTGLVGIILRLNVPLFGNAVGRRTATIPAFSIQMNYSIYIYI